MSYKYTIVQENDNDKTKLSFEFSASDEDEFVENLTSFMHSAGWILDGSLKVDYDEFDDLDSEVSEYSNEYRNSDVEGFMNFEFPEGKNESLYNYTSDDMEMIAEKSQENGQTYSTWPFPSDRPSQPTYRVDSIYATNSDEPSFGV
tara:strand:- start:167 stop:604 length:438 start_codon:yes stop_codon:yes gene_type:complete